MSVTGPQHGGRSCTACGTSDTPQWREGPSGPKTLCNACGVKRFRSMKQRNVPTSSSRHSHAKKRVKVAVSRLQSTDSDESTLMTPPLLALHTDYTEDEESEEHQAALSLLTFATRGPMAYSVHPVSRPLRRWRTPSCRAPPRPTPYRSQAWPSTEEEESSPLPTADACAWDAAPLLLLLLDQPVAASAAAAPSPSALQSPFMNDPRQSAPPVAAGAGSGSPQRSTAPLPDTFFDSCASGAGGVSDEWTHRQLSDAAHAACRVLQSADAASLTAEEWCHRLLMDAERKQRQAAASARRLLDVLREVEGAVLAAAAAAAGKAPPPLCAPVGAAR